MTSDSMTQVDMKQYTIKEEGGFRYHESGEGEVLLLLHGLFGALSNFQFLINHFSASYKVCIPILPLFDLPKETTSVGGLLKHVEDFIEYKGYDRVILIGNSLGGHIAQLYALEHPLKTKALVLTASSGLFEESLGNTYPRKGDYEFIRERTAKTFYNPAMATKELVDEVFDIVNNREKALSVLYIAKSAMRHNLREEVVNLKMPVLLIWGGTDHITPPFVGEEYKQLIPQAELHILENCGHAPMMEEPERFNELLAQFLQHNKL
jgi:2-hydroxy-6-oxonona-2,4-dienedioate hydrolase